MVWRRTDRDRMVRGRGSAIGGRADRQARSIAYLSGGVSEVAKRTPDKALGSEGPGGKASDGTLACCALAACTDGRTVWYRIRSRPRELGWSGGG